MSIHFQPEFLFYHAKTATTLTLLLGTLTFGTIATAIFLIIFVSPCSSLFSTTHLRQLEGETKRDEVIIVSTQQFSYFPAKRTLLFI